MNKERCESLFINKLKKGMISMMMILGKKDRIVPIDREGLMKLFIENGYQQISDDTVKFGDIEYKITESEFANIFEVKCDEDLRSIFIALTPHGVKNVQRWMTIGIPWNMPWKYADGAANLDLMRFIIEIDAKNR